MKKLLLIFSFYFAGFQLCSSAYAQEWHYEVQKGDSLYEIAKNNLIDESYFSKLKTYNNISRPFSLRPGRTIRAPIAWVSNFPSYGELLSVVGKVLVNPGNEQTDASVGRRLEVGDLLETGQNSTAILSFANQSTVSIGPLSILSISSARQNQEGSVVKARISIKKGDIEVFSNPARIRGNRLEIESPSAISAVRGTKFRVRVDANTASTSTEVISGDVNVSANKVTKKVRDQQGIITIVGKPPADPVKLLNKVSVDQIDTIFTDFGGIKWKSLVAAKQYRVQVFSDSEFNTIVYDKHTESNQVDDIFFVEDGEYFVRIRAIDANGLAGLDAVQSFNVNARPKVPYILSPLTETSTVTTNPEFVWSMPVGADHFHFQLASDKGFNHLVTDELIAAANQFVIKKTLDPGIYYWHVASIIDEDQGPYTDIATLTINAMPEFAFAPVKAGSLSEFEISLGSDSVKTPYHVQLARDVHFTKLIYSDWVQDNKFVFKADEAGSYFIRIGVHDSITDKIKYTDAQKIIKPFKDWKLILGTLVLGLLFVL